MDCELSQQLTAYLDSELDAQARQRFEEHLSRCPSCPAELLRVGSVVEQLRQMPGIEPSAQLRRRVLLACDEPAGAGWRSWLSRWAWPAGSIAAAAAITALIIHVSPVRAPVDRSLGSADLSLMRNLELMDDLPVVATSSLSDEDLEVVADLDQLEKGE